MLENKFFAAICTFKDRKSRGRRYVGPPFREFSPEKRADVGIRLYFCTLFFEWAILQQLLCFRNCYIGNSSVATVMEGTVTDFVSRPLGRFREIVPLSSWVNRFMMETIARCYLSESSQRLGLLHSTALRPSYPSRERTNSSIRVCPSSQ